MRTYFTKNWMIALLLCAAALVAPAPVRAEGCGKIGELADKWHELADYIEEHAEDGELPDSDSAKVTAEMKLLIRPTNDVATLLVKEFKGSSSKRVRALGKQILAAVEELVGLKEDDGWDEDLEIIDRLVSELDKVVELCEG